MKLSREFKEGFKMGYATALDSFKPEHGYDDEDYDQEMSIRNQDFRQAGVRTKPKRKQSKKQKLLTSMTAKKWKSYSKGSGRKTYFEIRSQVSSSKAYKSKAKKL